MSRRKKTTEQVMVTDAFSNPMFRLGFGSQSPLEASEYPLTRLTDNYALLNSMYRSGSVLQSVVDIIPAGMLREWFTVKGNIDPEDIDVMQKALRKIHLRDQLNEGLRWGRLYGGAVGIILLKGQEGRLDKPLNLKSILPGSFACLLILDRWSGVSPSLNLVLDISDPDFGLPEYYDISSGDNGNIVARVHHSRVIRFTGRDLPYLEKMAECYWGESEVEPIFTDIRLYDNVMANMGGLTFRANIDTMSIKNLEQLFSVGSTEMQKRFWNMMQAQSVAQSNFGMRLVDQETQVSNQQYSFTGWQYVIDAIQVNLSAATHIPITKLFGQSPGGMNATGESDTRNYYDFIDGQRETKLRPALERLLPVICMSAWGNVPEDAEIDFPPLWTPTATEIAQIAKMKADAIIGAFQAGMLDLGQSQKELKLVSDETGMFGSIEDEDIEKNKGKTYQDVTAMQDPLAGLTGGGDDTEGAEEGSPFEATDSYPGRIPRRGKGNRGGSLPRNLVVAKVDEAKKDFSKYKNVRFGSEENDEVYNVEKSDDPHKMENHFYNHGASVGAKTISQYQNIGIKFMEAPLGPYMAEITLANGARARYDYSTGLLGFVRRNGIFSSVYIPKKGEWEKEVAKHGQL